VVFGALWREATENHTRETARPRCDFRNHSADGNTRRKVGGKTIDPGRDGRVGD
jgi:hypothetical protein